jgi:hypothetical protein
MNRTELPPQPVDLLRNIAPATAGTGKLLVCPALPEAVSMYSQDNGLRTKAFWNAAPGTRGEEIAAEQSAAYYLLRTALEVASAPNLASRDLWSGRFTEGAIELYGQPELADAGQLLLDEYRHLQELKLRDDKRVSQGYVALLLHKYRPIIEALPPSEESVIPESAPLAEREALHKYGQAIHEQFRGLFDLVDTEVAGKQLLGPVELLDLFTKAVAWLARYEDSAWNDWTVLMNPNDVTLTTSTTDWQILVGSRYAPLPSGLARSYVAHELLRHALGGKNGFKTGDMELAARSAALPAVDDAEEGHGGVIEAALNGEMPSRIVDMCLDTALALGIFDGVQMSRPQIFQISYARQLIRAELKGANRETKVSLVSRVWGHLDRTFRADSGDDRGNNHAIFTRDSCYYPGYKKMIRYITEQLAAGMSAQEIFTYLSRGIFDPTNPQHVERVMQAYGVSDIRELY